VFRLVGRFIALALLAGAFAAAVIDGARSIAASQLTLTQMGQTLYSAFPGKLAALQSFIQQIYPPLWDPVLLNALRAPTWLLLGLVGGLLFYLLRRRARPIGHSDRDR
jgi:hypothetical protein